MSSLVTDRQIDDASRQPAPQKVLQHLQKLLASRLLRESHQLQTFLELIVRETIEGRSKYIKEYVLGCQVFGRKPDYDPRQDGIVRIQATVLRKRLAKYYEQEGAIDPIIIDIPRGGYVPLFRVRQAEISQPPPSLPGPSVKAPRQGLILAFLTGVVLTASIATIVSPKVVRPFRVTAATGAEFPELWGPFLQRGANDIIAYGVPLFFASEGLY